MHSAIDWLEAVRYRWKLVALVTALITLLALAYLTITPKTYTANANLLVDRQQPDPVDAPGAPIPADQQPPQQPQRDGEGMYPAGQEEG